MTMANVSGRFLGSVGPGRKVQEGHLPVCLKDKDEALLSHRPQQARPGRGLWDRITLWRESDTLKGFVSNVGHQEKVRHTTQQGPHCMLRRKRRWGHLQGGFLGPTTSATTILISANRKQGPKGAALALAPQQDPGYDVPSTPLRRSYCD